MASLCNSTASDQLVRNIDNLTNALEKSESRYAQLIRLIRWCVVGIGAVTISVAVAFTDIMSTAYAQKEQATPEAQSVVDALNNINRNLALFGMAAHYMQQARPAIEASVMNNQDVQSYMVQYLTEKEIDPTPKNMQQHAIPALINSAVTTMVNTVVLMNRIRDDSNSFREVIGGPVPALNAIQKELKLVNAALMSVPTMAVQMDLMNRNMASMSHSMGSTLGRAGSWMPW